MAQQTELAANATPGQPHSFTAKASVEQPTAIWTSEIRGIDWTSEPRGVDYTSALRGVTWTADTR